jgi:branched-chain amino acid transport system permease protein
MNRNIGRKSFSFFLLIILAFTPPIFIKNEYVIHILITICINILIASSFRLIMTTGLFSFCHTAFVGIGGYASALTVMRLGQSSWVGLIFAPFVTMLIAIAFGLILLRLKGTYFFLATFAFGEIVMLVFTRFTNPFGGAAGLMHIPPPNPITIPGLLTIKFDSIMAFYYFALIITLVPLLITYRMDRSRMGAIWTGIQQADQLAQSVGINVMLYKIIAFTVGSSMAAVAGAFQAQYISHVHPGGFGFVVLVNYLTFVIVGGRKKFIGPVIGTSLLVLLGEFLGLYEDLAQYQAIIYGIILILFVIFLPEGIISLPDKVSSWYRELKSRGELGQPKTSQAQYHESDFDPT